MERKLITCFLIMITGIQSFELLAQMPADSLSEQINILEGKINALEEKTTTHESDLGKLTKIKISGYIQAQFENYQHGLLKTNDPDNTFYIRRARVKVTYEAADGVKFVLQPDFSTGNLSLKDAYAVASYPKLPWLSLWAGQFNRPNYEVEYSSGQREVLERSRVIRTIYPGEREVGAKLEIMPVDIPLKLQLALLNGNFTGKELKDVDSKKDIMARAAYSFHLPGSIGVDVGAHTYYGGLLAKNKYVSDYKMLIDSTESNAGSYLDKIWFGGEMQVFMDLLGGMALKGEYIAGKNAFIGDSKTNPYKTRKFSGYYVYLIKNIGRKNQFVSRYDYFDPNTSLSGDAAAREVYYRTWTLAWQYYLNDNIRLTLNYEIPVNETNTTIQKDIKDNVLGIRVQARF